MLRRVIPAAILVVATGGTFWALRRPAPRPPSAEPGRPGLWKRPAGIVATINGQEIRAERFNAELARLVGDLDRVPAERVSQQARALLDRMIEAELVRQALAAAGGEVKEGAIDEELGRGARPAAGKAGAELEKELRRQGLTLSDVREQIRDRLARRRLLELRSQLAISDAEVRSEYEREPARFARPEQARVRVWIAAAPAGAAAGTGTGAVSATAAAGEGPSERARMAASAFATAVLGGADPAAAAAAHGLTGRPAFDLSRDSKEAELVTAVMALTPGGYSAPVRTRAGWAVARLQERRPAEPRSFDEAQADVRKALQGQRRRTEEGRLRAELRQGARIVEHVRL